MSISIFIVLIPFFSHTNIFFHQRKIQRIIVCITDHIHFRRIDSIWMNTNRWNIVRRSDQRHSNIKISFGIICFQRNLEKTRERFFSCLSLDSCLTCTVGYSCRLRSSSARIKRCARFLLGSVSLQYRSR